MHQILYLNDNLRIVQTVDDSEMDKVKMNVLEERDNETERDGMEWRHVKSDTNILSIINKALYMII